MLFVMSLYFLEPFRRFRARLTSFPNSALGTPCPEQAIRAGEIDAELWLAEQAEIEPDMAG
jgi:hypothetical protein